MGIRETQFIGLPEKTTQITAPLKRVNNKERFQTGMFDEHFYLGDFRQFTEAEKIHEKIKDLAKNYEFEKCIELREKAEIANKIPGPILYREEHQCSPWSSGPCIFTQLVDTRTEKTVCFWTEEQITEYL